MQTLSTHTAEPWSAQVSVPLNPEAEFVRIFESDLDGPRTTLPVANPTTSFWLSDPAANPLATEGSSGPLTQDADICIIGSGITGVSTAYHLAKSFAKNAQSPPLKVVIVEARHFCSGATGRNGGHLTADPCGRFRSLQKAYGTKEAIRGFELEKYTASQILKILKEENLEKTVDLVEGGRITLFLTSSDYENVRADYEAAKAAGMNLDGVEWFDKEYMGKTFGVAFPAVKYRGNNLWPLKLVTEFYRLTERQKSIDLHLHTRTPVTSINPISSDSDRRWELATPRGAIRCTRIVHATNGYASYLLPHIHGSDGIVPTRGQIIALRANVPFEHLGPSAWDANEGAEYWFPRPPSSDKSENTLVICGGARAAAGPPYESYVSDDSVVNGKISKALKDFLPGLFDDLFEKGREPEMEWTGIMGYTKLQDPFVGPVLDMSQPDKDKFKGQFISAGYQGHGMPRTFACAEAIAMMMVADIEGTPFEQPPWLPDRYLTWTRNYK